MNELPGGFKELEKQLQEEIQAIESQDDELGSIEESPLIDIPQQSSNPICPMLSVIETVVYTPDDKPARAIDTRFGYRLKSREQPYIRWLEINEKWISLDTGWIKRPGFIVIENLGAPNRATNPTPEEKTQDESLIVQLGLMGQLQIPEEDERLRDMHSPPKIKVLKLQPIPRILIPPKQVQRIILTTPTEWFMRCQGGTVEITLTAFPI